MRECAPPEPHRALCPPPPRRCLQARAVGATPRPCSLREWVSPGSAPSPTPRAPTPAAPLPSPSARPACDRALRRPCGPPAATPSPSHVSVCAPCGHALHCLGCAPPVCPLKKEKKSKKSSSYYGGDSASCGTCELCSAINLSPISHTSLGVLSHATFVVLVLPASGWGILCWSLWCLHSTPSLLTFCR